MRDKDIKFIEETMKFMEGRKVSADVVWHEPSEAKEVAANLCVKGDSVLKALIFIKSDGSPVLVVSPSDRRVCEKKLSALVGTTARLAKAKEVKSLTGREVSSLSPLGACQAISSIVVDESIKGKSLLVAPAGPCASVKIKTEDFFRIFDGAKVADVCAKKL